MPENQQNHIKRFLTAVKAEHGQSVASKCEEIIKQSGQEPFSPLQVLAQAISSGGVMRDLDEEGLVKGVFSSSFKSKYRDEPSK